MDRVSGQPGKAANPARGERRPDQYLYLLIATGAEGAMRQLQLEAVVSYPKAAGGWARPKVIRSQPYAGQVVFDAASPTDREVLQLLYAMPNNPRYYSAYSTSPRAILNGQVGVMALQQAASTGRLFLHDDHGGPGPALQWGPPQSLDWHWQEMPSPHATEPGWALRASLAAPASSSAKLCLNSPPLYLDAEQGLCGPVQVPGIADAQLALLLKAPPLKASALQKHQPELMRHLGKLPMPPMLQTLTRLEGITPTACLHLSPNTAADARFMGLIQAQLRFDYRGHRGWWADQGTTVLIDGPEGRVLLQRDAKSELNAITRLSDLGMLATDNGVFGIPGDGPQQDWLHWADNGFSVLRDAGFEVTVDDALTDWITHADTLSVQLQPQDDDQATSHWFDLSLGMEINGQRHNILPWLPELIAAAAASPPDPATGLPSIPPFVYLRAPDGQGFVRLPTDTLKPWLAALLELVGDRAHDFSADSL